MTPPITPEERLTPQQWGALLRAFDTWLSIRLVHEPRYRALLESGDAERISVQLKADIWHSALLYRLLVEGKPALEEPPPVDHSYPVYPD